VSSATAVTTAGGTVVTATASTSIGLTCSGAADVCLSQQGVAQNVAPVVETGGGQWVRP
jgi:hypothetical protein